MSNAGLKHLSFLVIDHPFASLVTLVITYFLWKAFYNYFFHPLAHYPGPFLAKFTDLYLAYVIGSVPTFGLSLHQKHGIYPLLFSFMAIGVRVK